MRTGSLVNNIKSIGPNQATPTLDMGATILGWSDRHAATVVAIGKFKSGAKRGQARSVIVREDTATIVKGSAQDGSAQYTYEYDDNGQDTEFFVTKDGSWKSKSGTYLSMGARETYYDPSF